MKMFLTDELEVSAALSLGIDGSCEQ